MGWTLRYHREAKKFLKKLDEDRRKLVLNKLNELRKCLEGGRNISNQSFGLEKVKG